MYTHMYYVGIDILGAICISAFTLLEDDIDNTNIEIFIYMCVNV
jgi:hypothetical protein